MTDLHTMDMGEYIKSYCMCPRANDVSPETCLLLKDALCVSGPCPFFGQHPQAQARI